MLPPEAPSATSSARANNSLAPTADTVPFVGGIGTGPFGAVPWWIADLSGSNKAKIIDDIPVTRNCGSTMQIFCNPYTGNVALASGGGG